MSFFDTLKGTLGIGQEPALPGPKELGGPVVIEASDSIDNDEELQRELMALASKAVEASDVIERLQIQRVRRSREYAAGRQGTFYDEAAGTFLPINNSALSGYGLAGGDDDDDSEPMLCWNLYQATSLYIIAVLSGGPPTVRFFPANADNNLDIATAKASNTITELFYRTNDIDALIAREAYYLFTDGKFFGYVRHKVDAQRFGTHDEDITAPNEIKLSEDAFHCQSCGMQSPMGGLPGQILPGDPCPAINATGQQCGAPIDEQSFVPGITTTVQQKVGTKQVPNGAEVLDIFGALEVRVFPPSAKDLSYAQGLTLKTEVDVSALRFEYQNMADKITASSSGNGVDQVARLARVATQGGGWQSPGGSLVDNDAETVTYERTWLRPSIFFRITHDTEKRDRLLRLFPDGVYLASAGTTFLKARNESLDAYWVECFAYPGDGQIRPSIGEILLDPSDALNDLMDSELQNARMSTPQLFVDSKAVDRRAWMQARQRGGNVFPVVRQGNESIDSNFYSTVPSGNNAGATNLRQEIFGPISQYLSATLPGMTGQSDPNLKTAKAYAQAKEQSMGRIGVVWRAIKQAHVEIVTKAVRHYVDNRTADVTLPQITPAGFENANIRLDDLHGQTVAYPESDEAYPISASDRRQVYEQLLQNPDPSIHAIATELDNLEIAKSTMGWGNLVLPGEKSRMKQMKEIQALTQAQPVQVPTGPPPMGPIGPPPMGPIPAPMAPHPVTGQMVPVGPPRIGPVGPPQMGPIGPPPTKPTPSIPIAQKTDEHKFEFLTCVSWLHSEAGMDAAIKNPAGYQNVQLHAEAHFDAMQPPPPPPVPPEPVVVSGHLVQDDGTTVWSPPGAGPGAKGPLGAVGQPSGPPTVAPGGILGGPPPMKPHTGGNPVPPMPPRPLPGPAPAPKGPPQAAPPPGAGILHPIAGKK